MLLPVAYSYPAVGGCQCQGKSADYHSFPLTQCVGASEACAGGTGTAVAGSETLSRPGRPGGHRPGGPEFEPEVAGLRAPAPSPSPSESEKRTSTVRQHFIHCSFKFVSSRKRDRLGFRNSSSLSRAPEVPRVFTTRGTVVLLATRYVWEYRYPRVPGYRRWLDLSRLESAPSDDRDVTDPKRPGCFPNSAKDSQQPPSGMMSRSVALGVCALLSAMMVGVTSARKPNLLFMMADQMRGDLVGSELVELPNINSIGQNGVRFSRAYSSTPSCTPARAAILTGQKPWNHGMLGYGSIAYKYPFEMPTALRTMAGYHTAVIGKDHFGWAGRKAISHDYELLEIFDGIESFNDDYCHWFHEHRNNQPIDSGWP
eukprot:2162931-Rhodomonas_salina.1